MLRSLRKKKEKTPVGWVSGSWEARGTIGINYVCISSKITLISAHKTIRLLPLFSFLSVQSCLLRTPLMPCTSREDLSTSFIKATCMLCKGICLPHQCCRKFKVQGQKWALECRQPLLSSHLLYAGMLTFSRVQNICKEPVSPLSRFPRIHISASQASHSCLLRFISELKEMFKMISIRILRNYFWENLDRCTSIPKNSMFVY